MKITEKCNVLVASALVAALIFGYSVTRAGDQPRWGRSLCGARAAE